jgi:hypothetical protein
MPHDLDLFHEALLSLLLGISSFFRKGLYCALALIFHALDEINGSKVSFPDFLDRPIVFMKSYLIEMPLQDISPLLLIIVGKLKLLLPFLNIKVDLRLFDHKPEIKVEEQMHSIVDDAALMNCNWKCRCRLPFFPMRFVQDYSKRLFAVVLKKLSFHLSLSIFFYIL